MGCDGKLYTLTDTSEESIALKNKYLGMLADKDCVLVVEGVGQGLDETAMLDYNGGYCNYLKDKYQVQSETHGIHDISFPANIGPFKCAACEETVAIE